MAYDEGLAERLREVFSRYRDVEEKKMFGGLAFMIRHHMCCGVVNDSLMARVGPKQYDACLSQANVREMDFTGRPMKGMVYISPEGIDADDELQRWVNVCLDFVNSLPPKK